MYYVDISEVPEDTLEFLGYYRLAENEKFKFYRDIYGDEHIVEKAHPRIHMEDVNDAAIIGRITGQQILIQAPPKKTN